MPTGIVRRPLIVQPWKASYKPADLLRAIEIYAGYDQFGGPEARAVADVCNMSESQARSVRVNYLYEIRAVKAAHGDARKIVLAELKAHFERRVAATKGGADV